ncbi:xylosyltransferase oxt [Spodoptera frugiperda]|uniref:protein xylosyltransferase n=1 Tax=Spodoptera frugiperda TaxID=7108 RepID=A0A9R0EM67_SPOFR|nr:xylosyltransferase oxt [Spodoptera frugiperda]
MAFLFRKYYYKYTKCLVITVLLAFFIHIFIAISLFPSINDNISMNSGYVSSARQLVGEVSARKNNIGFGDDEDLSSNNKNHNKPSTYLRLEELDFKPPCEIKSKEAISAIHRAKTQNCKQQIVNKTCLIQSGSFYPHELPNTCRRGQMTFGKYLGCYADQKKLRLLTGFYGNYANTNSPSACLDICIQAGFMYAGVQYASECFCGESLPQASAAVADHLCDMKCPGNATQHCGGYFTMNIYETGLSKFTPRVPITASSKNGPVQIVFLLTLNGRALRQVHRLINVLYRSNHYFYIHVDKRQDYLHRKLSPLEQLPNVKLATTRFSTIWGGASLLKMLLAAMKDFMSLGWKWDFVINLSESDFPIKSLEELENFLSANKGLNFVKSHGREVQRFIKKQGLDKTFIECDTHMWRVGERKLPRGIIIDGGSDWIALSPEFVSYVVGKQDQLLTGLDVIFQHTLLPAESFFHTVLRNSHFCDSYVDNNLHVTNWKRKLGCKCQYKHVVDWCGCSPNDFRTEDWPRIQNTQDRQLFFARKFEPIINQEIINRVEQYIGIKDHHLIPNLEAYWQSIYNVEDMTASTDDILLTHASSIVRHNARILLEEGCKIEPDIIIEINSYNYADVYKGNLILHKAIVHDNIEILIETWYKPKKHIELNFENPYMDNIKIFKVSSDYDQKETTFRNLAGILGPLSEPILLYEFSAQLDKKSENLTLIWLDPTGAIGDVNMIHVDENNLTNFIKPNLKAPLLPGIWKVGLFEQNRIIVATKFLISPLEYFSGKDLSHQESSIIHSGSQNSYKNFSNIKPKNFLPDNEQSILLQKISQSNIQRIDQDLREWIDGLSLEFYNVLGSCITFNNEIKEKLICGRHKFENCATTQWSSLTPDPKGTIGKLNKKTGQMERV